MTKYKVVFNTKWGLGPYRIYKKKGWAGRWKPTYSCVSLAEAKQVIAYAKTQPEEGTIVHRE